MVGQTGFWAKNFGSDNLRNELNHCGKVPNSKLLLIMTMLVTTKTLESNGVWLFLLGLCLRFSRNSFSIQSLSKLSPSHPTPFPSSLLPVCVCVCARARTRVCVCMCVARIPMRDEPLQKAKNSYSLQASFLIFSFPE